jgi:hypothetical protein
MKNAVPHVTHFLMGVISSMVCPAVVKNLADAIARKIWMNGFGNARQ